MKNKINTGTTKFYMKTERATKEGLYALYIQVIKNRKVGYISLKIYGSKDMWDPQQEQFIIKKGLRKTEERAENNEREINNETIARHKKRIKKILGEFEENEVDWTINQFKEAFVPQNIQQGNVYDYLTSLIKKMEHTNRAGNSTVYDSLLDNLIDFDNKFKVRVFSEINYDYVLRYDDYKIKKGNKRNTRKNSLSTLRALFNAAIKEGVASRKSYPFGIDGYSVAKLKEQTEKRYLPTSYLNVIKHSSSLDPGIEFARKLFLFSYYSYGMSFVDMAHLENKDIIAGENGRYLVYKRQKTKNKADIKPIKILLRNELSELLSELRAIKPPIKDYLLPIIYKPLKGKELYDHIRNGSYQTYRYALKVLGDDLGFKMNLTSYVSRHTMAMQLKTNSVPADIISQVMGHQETSTTKTYLDSFEDSVVDDATSVL